MLVSQSCRASPALIPWTAFAPSPAATVDRTRAVAALLKRIPQLNAGTPVSAGPCNVRGFSGLDCLGLALRLLPRPNSPDTRVCVSELQSERFDDPPGCRDCRDWRWKTIIQFVALDQRSDSGAVLVWIACDEDPAAVYTGAGDVWIARASCSVVPVFRNIEPGVA